LLSLDETLGDIFPEDDAWADVSDGSTDFRKGTTVKELLTMTTGFIDPFLLWSNDFLHGRAGFDDMPEERGGAIIARLSFHSNHWSQRPIPLLSNVPNPELYHLETHWHDS
jgi:CubicO group peptidase (beta-lactamase class C family)